MVIIEREHAGVARVAFARDAHVAGAQIAVGRVGYGHRAAVAHGLTLPRAPIAMRRDHHPLPPQRVPALFPDHRAPREMTSAITRESVAAVCRGAKEAAIRRTGKLVAGARGMMTRDRRGDRLAARMGVRMSALGVRVEWWRWRRAGCQ